MVCDVAGLAAVNSTGALKAAWAAITNPRFTLKKGGHKGARTSVTRRVCRFAFAVVDGIFS